MSLVFLGGLLQGNELALVCSQIEAFSNIATEIWFDQSQVIHPDQMKDGLQCPAFLSQYVLQYCSKLRTCLGKRLLLARPVAACQTHNWTTRDGKWPLTNDSLQHMLCEIGGFQSKKHAFSYFTTNPVGNTAVLLVVQIF